MKKILESILKYLARTILLKYKPFVIGITGSVGKTSTKETTYRALKSHYKTRRNMKSYNNELGVPLTIIGAEAGGRSFLRWAAIIFKALKLILIESKYPEVLILEMGADKPGDIKYLTQFTSPKVGVVTAIGQFPVHIEFFPERDKLIEEKTNLVKSLTKDGVAILNYDDLSVRDMRQSVSEGVRIINYGFGQGADLQMSEFKQNFIENKASISFKVDYQGSVVPIKISKTLGKQQAYAATAAIATGLAMGLNLVQLANSLKKHRALPGRTRLIRGIKRTWLIDDSYNSSPTAATAGLEILVSFLSPGRKIAVLGDMLELGDLMEDGHRVVGQKAAQGVDILMTIGPRAKFIAEEAKKEGLNSANIFEFMDISSAGLKLQEIMKTDDVVLIKGSRAMKMEEIVREVMAHPEKANKLLIK